LVYASDDADVVTLLAFPRQKTRSLNVSDNAFLHPFTQPRTREFLTLVSGHGSTVVDSNGKEYIDAMASLWYVNIGHGRQDMIDAIVAQANKLATYHTFGPFTNEPTEQLAAMIAGMVPMDRARVFFTSSGSEAVDSAMKIARVAQREAGHPERQIIISREHGYHGVTYGGTSAQGIPANREGFGPLVGKVVNVPSDNVEAMSQVFDEFGGEIAAVLTEPLQGAGGVYPPPPGYLDSLRRLCDQHGAYLIMDEVICGFGRTGQWFGSDTYGIRPDIMTFAKAVSSGYVPLGGVAVGSAVRDALEANEGFVLKHGHTYSGHPLATAAGIKAIEIQQEEGLVERANHIGARLSAGLQALADDGTIDHHRGIGAVWGAQMADGVDTPAVRQRMLEMGVIVRPFDDTLGMCPPLIITDEEIDKVVDVMATAIG